MHGNLFQQERYCLALGEEELAQLRLFCAQRKQKSLGQGVARLLPPKLEGYTCKKCKKLLDPGEYGVFAARAGEQSCWHRPCFACQACGQGLINLIYFYHEGHLYCGRHHAELLRPRCPACDQVEYQEEALGEFPGTHRDKEQAAGSSELGTSQGHPIPFCSLEVWACGT